MLALTLSVCLQDVQLSAGLYVCLSSRAYFVSGSRLSLTAVRILLLAVVDVEGLKLLLRNHVVDLDQFVFLIFFYLGIGYF